jgi:predicted house-cleaning noncanonical NTP pyrophosphatase (MazG superfamily)
MIYNKLVRDRIPDIIKRNGEDSVTRTLKVEEFRHELLKKLQEEIAEFAESSEVDELVDILEVVYALALSQGIDPLRLDEMRARKQIEKGGFERRIFLIETHAQHCESMK